MVYTTQAQLELFVSKKNVAINNVNKPRSIFLTPPLGKGYSPSKWPKWRTNGDYWPLTSLGISLQAWPSLTNGFTSNLQVFACNAPPSDDPTQ